VTTGSTVSSIFPCRRQPGAYAVISSINMCVFDRLRVRLLPLPTHFFVIVFHPTTLPLPHQSRTTLSGLVLCFLQCTYYCRVDYCDVVLNIGRDATDKKTAQNHMTWHWKWTSVNGSACTSRFRPHFILAYLRSVKLAGFRDDMFVLLLIYQKQRLISTPVSRVSARAWTAGMLAMVKAWYVFD